jgi:hypothetical protein
MTLRIGYHENRPLLYDILQRTDSRRHHTPRVASPSRRCFDVTQRVVGQYHHRYGRWWSGYLFGELSTPMLLQILWELLKHFFRVRCDDITPQRKKGFLGLEWRVPGKAIPLDYVRDRARSASDHLCHQSPSLNAQTPNAQHPKLKAQQSQPLHGSQKSNALASLTDRSGASLRSLQRPKRAMSWPSPCMSWSTRLMLRLDASIILGREATLVLSAHVSDETSPCYLACFVLASHLPPSTSAAVRPTTRDELRLVPLRVPAVAHRARRVTPQPVAVEGLFTSSCPVKVAGPVVASAFNDPESVDTQRLILNTQHPTPIRRANSSEDRSPPRCVGSRSCSRSRKSWYRISATTFRDELPEGGKTHVVGSLAPKLGANA